MHTICPTSFHVDMELRSREIRGHRGGRDRPASALGGIPPPLRVPPLPNSHVGALTTFLAVGLGSGKPFPSSL